MSMLEAVPRVEDAARRSDQIVVFAGPSLPPAARPANPRLVWRGPAAAGDTLTVGAPTPGAVLLVDGLFDASPAVRHKELLQLMAGGVPVIGAASMGALRAAELAPFGMIGVGRIFTAYTVGALVGDDEVALLHGPEEAGWTALTEPMVNIRATVLAAVRRRVIAPHAGRFVLRAAKAIFYKERTWPRLLEAMRALGWRPAAQARALARWLPSGQVDLKRADALAGLHAALSLDLTVPFLSPAPPRTLHARALARQVVRRQIG